MKQRLQKKNAGVSVTGGQVFPETIININICRDKEPVFLSWLGRLWNERELLIWLFMLLFIITL